MIYVFLSKNNSFEIGYLIHNEKYVVIKNHHFVMIFDFYEKISQNFRLQKSKNLISNFYK